jgi:hypothetical protein
MQITKDNLFGYKSEYNCLQNARLITIDQCQYGREYMKPTHLWTNDFNFVARPRCKYKGIKGCHKLNGIQKTSGKGKAYYEKRSKIEPPLFIDILEKYN